MMKLNFTGVTWVRLSTQEKIVPLRLDRPKTWKESLVVRIQRWIINSISWA